MASPEQHPPYKATIQRNVAKYQLNDTSLNFNKGRSGRRATVRAAENIQAVQEALEVKKHLSATRNGLGISAISIC